jgi:rRNA maturation endonuclease Nob1
MSSANEVRCNGCRKWFSADRHECPGCGHARPGFNKWLYTAKMNGQLNQQLVSADREKRFERSLRRG